MEMGAYYLLQILQRNEINYRITQRKEIKNSVQLCGKMGSKIGGKKVK